MMEAHDPISRNSRDAVLVALCGQALAQYRTRVLDNIDLDRLDGPRAKARVIAGALMERGDARAFAMARKILAAIGE